MRRTDRVVWQLVDSAFPSGGFAHSGGLEAAWRHGEIEGSAELVEYLRAMLAQLARGHLPFVVAAHRGEAEFEALDRHCDAFLSNHVANRASRRQGMALLLSCEAVFPAAGFEDLRGTVARLGGPAHLPVVFGRMTQLLGLELDEAVLLFLFISLRGAVSSAVRLGAIGPLDGQSIQNRLGPVLEELAASRRGTTTCDAAQTAPVIDILQATHDRLYSRLFQS